MRENKLNDLEAKDWMKFTKTWFVHNPPPRKKAEVLHPAKYPESMIEEFVRFFTKKGQLVFDPFLGTGSTLVACHNSGRQGIGIELQEKYGKIAIDRIRKLEEQKTLDDNQNNSTQKVIIGDSFKVKEIWEKEGFEPIDFLICSPPYGPMLNKKGLVQEKREEKGLDTKYSEDELDLGNVTDYNGFVSKLVDLFVQIKPLVREGAYLVVVLQNYREGPEFKTLAWDFASKMKKHYLMTGCRIWCQDNKTLYPYGYRYSFVPNVHHHYCLIFRKVEEVSKKVLPKKPTIQKTPNHPPQKEAVKTKELTEPAPKSPTPNIRVNNQDQLSESNLIITLPSEEVDLYNRKAAEKIAMEGWSGRNKAVKTNNFFNCYVTEEAFKQLLAKSGKWCRNRGLYVGDATGAGVDFEVKLNGEIKSIGIRSINDNSLNKWKSVAYPDDRYRDEQEKIADFIVACHNSNGSVRFLGIISKEELLSELDQSERKYSQNNQEYFRTVSLERFSLGEMNEFLVGLDGVK